MKKKILTLLVMAVLIIPSNVFASTIQYDDAKIEFEIDDSVWKHSELSKERQFIDKKWVNDCGTLMIGTYDYYSDLSSEELGVYTRKTTNYKNVFKNEDDLEDVVSEYRNAYGVNYWEYKSYGVKFVYMSGTNTQYGIEMKQDIYMTVNNGYLFSIQYVSVPTTQPNNCKNTVDEIARTVKSTVPVEEIEIVSDDNEDSSSDVMIGILSMIILGVIIVIIALTRKGNKNSQNKQDEVKRIVRKVKVER